MTLVLVLALLVVLLAIGMPDCSVWITVSAAPFTVANAHTAADIAACTGCSFTVTSVMMPRVPSDPTKSRVRS